MKYAIVFVTVSKHEEAKKIARILVEKKLASCVNIISGIDSIYRWQGKIEESSEVLLMAKTKGSLWRRLTEEVKKNHSYDTPEIIFLPVSRGLRKYLDWIDESLK
ncbi:MAG: divalent-cation tolerance protein CutA [Candidatus Omnitrophica bacterium]|nr:divalent-cation tolerance protein CutA [Candidatus Omnitrophota bacterium]